MAYPRSSGVLLHPTSLPGGYGIGDLGREAYRFVDFLASAGQSYWQVLPLGPTGYGDSPYQCLSTFAGNHLLISFERLAEWGISATSIPGATEGPVNFGFVVVEKTRRLRSAFQSFREKAPAPLRDRFSGFLAGPHRVWLQDYALFRALKDHFGGKCWTEWEPDAAQRQPAALEHYSRTLAEEVLFHQWLQFLFFGQWAEVKAYANQNGVKIIGDIPIFVAHDSADVWAHPELFHLDDKGRCTVVAGVPPDYFSATGQLWGNPLYRWDRLAGTRYRWWNDRIRMTLALVDIVRLDHFRGFEAYWEVPAGESTAVNGRWVKGPGAGLFTALERSLGTLPLIAEDLGLITPEVDALRRQFSLPGMKILQFAFSDDAGNAYLPHNFDRNSVVYTGSHDNDTTLGWYRSVDDATRRKLERYTGSDDVPWALIRQALASVADLAIVPAQDLLSLGTEARMNCPGKASGNWSWRIVPGQLGPDVARRLKDLSEVYGRA